MTKRQRQFLIILAELCDTYNVEFSYTRDDDGIHISVDGEEIFVGYMFDPAKELRQAVEEDKQ